MTRPHHTVIRAQDRPWRKGIFPMSEYQPLWADPTTGRQIFLARFGPGGSIPCHDHPGREFAYVLEGEMEVGGERLGPGDFLTAGPGETHDVKVKEGVVFLIMIDAPIEEVSPDTPGCVPVMTESD